MLQRKKWETFSPMIQSNLCKLQVCIGHAVEKDLYNDGLKFGKGKQDIKQLKKVEPTASLKNRNPLLISFLEGVTWTTINNESEKK